MQDPTILDDFTPDPESAQQPDKIRKTFFRIELALWGLCVAGFLLKMTGFQHYYYLLVLPFSALGLFYLGCATWIFGALGWRRIIGSHLVGFALLGSVLPILFVIERWPPAAEQIQNALRLSIMATVVTLLCYFIQKDSPRGGKFFLRVLARTVWTMVLAGFLMEVVAQGR